MDVKIVGDIFSRGSWAIKPLFSYKNRYHYSGTLNLSYALNRIGIEGTPEFSREEDYRIGWTHTQDKKARPKSSFSASVNIQSRNYNKFNISSSPDQYLTNTFQSSINYATNFGGKAFLNRSTSTTARTPSIKRSPSTSRRYRSRSTRFIPSGIPKGSERPNGTTRSGSGITWMHRTDTARMIPPLFQPGWTEHLQNGHQTCSACGRNMEHPQVRELQHRPEHERPDVLLDVQEILC